jgi:hypothetical protein
MKAVPVLITLRYSNDGSKDNISEKYGNFSGNILVKNKQQDGG